MRFSFPYHLSQEVQEELERIVWRIVDGYGPQKVILFGSYAYGEPHPDSDLDLLIIKETPERFMDRWVAIRRLLSDPHRHIPLETLVLTPQEVQERQARSDQFVEEILTKGWVLYEEGVPVS
ncbi:MAG: nucleotidyltransferase domain-containing protein [Chloroflexi bacterium]|nr:nucleotidyltransferase domain-containing protein [Chloroflexota bacterium]